MPVITTPKSVSTDYTLERGDFIKISSMNKEIL